MKNSLKILFSLMGIIAYSGIFGQDSDSLKTEDVLKMSLTDLLNIQVVTASKTKQGINEVPATVRVITEDQIKTRGYLTLEEALSDLPGFQFRNINGFNSYIFMRGAPSQNNLVLLMIDGVQINELNSGGFYGGGQFIMSDIKQIEVVYGPASSLYGTNAVSGIINIITKGPDKKAAHVQLLGGTFNTGMANFNVKNKTADNVGYSLSAQYKTTEKANLAGADGDFNWTENMENFENDLSISGRLNFKKLKAGIDFQEKRSSMTTNFKSVDDIYLDKNTLWDIYFLNAYAKYTTDLKNNWSLKSSAYYRNSTVKPNTINTVIKPTDTTPGRQVGYYRPNHLIGIENQLSFIPNEKFSGIAGIIGEDEWLSDGFSITHSSSYDIEPPTPPKPDILNNTLLSYYAHIKYSFIKNLAFNGGIRHDFSSYYGNVFVPRAGMFLYSGKLTAKALYSRAFRAPRAWDYHYGSGNADLNPEKMKSWELSTSYRANNKLNIGGSVYRNTVYNKLTIETADEEIRWVNKDKVNTTGFELFIFYTSHPVDFYANYTYNDSRDQDKNFIPEISRHTANAGITYSFYKDLKLNLRANYLGERNNPVIIPSTGNTDIEDALVFNGSVTYSGLRNFVFQFKANNILNAKYYHPSNRFNGRYRQPQRAVVFSAIYNFELNRD